MAKRRMFSLEIVDTDAFMDMPASVQLLYFHLGMRADDDGFVASPRRVARNIGAEAEDLNTLEDNGYITLFDSGVCMIRDWKTNNYLRPDRYNPTRYQGEKNSVSPADQSVNPDDKQPGIPHINQSGIPHDNQSDIPPVDPGKDRLGKDRSGEDRSDEDRSELKTGECAAEPPRARFSPPSVEEVASYCRERRNGIDPQHFVDYYTANGWSQGKGRPIRDWQAAVRTWERVEGNGRHSNGSGRDDTPIPGVTCL